MKKKKANTFTRRAALQASLAGGALAALRGSPFASPRRAPGNHKLLVIFLRGGCDGVNTVIPYGDSEYNPTRRKATYISQTGTPAPIPVPNNSFCMLNPAMRHIQPLLNNQEIAFLHAVGNPARTGSHFEDMRTMETAITQCGTAPSFDPEEGWITRMVQQLGWTGFPGASISEDLQQLFQTSDPDRLMAHVQRYLSYPDESNSIYSLNTNRPTLDTKYRGQGAATSPPSGFGLRGLYEGTPQTGHTLDVFARRAGLVMLYSEIEISRILPPLAPPTSCGEPYCPLGGAIYPFGKSASHQFYPLPRNVPASAGGPLMTNSESMRKFYQAGRDAIWGFRSIPGFCVAGIELGSFDTHANQGSTSGRLAELLEAVCFLIHNMYLEANDPAFEPDSLTTLVISEFGRTSEANSNGGTDHGGSTPAWVVGPFVRPDAHGSMVYNCDAGSWPGMFSANDADFGCNPIADDDPKTYVANATDFRAVFGELLKKVLCVSNEELEAVIPNYSALHLGSQELGYLV